MNLNRPIPALTRDVGSHLKKKNSPWVMQSYSIYDNVNLDEKQDVFVLPVMANSKDGQSHKNKYLDNHRKI